MDRNDFWALVQLATAGRSPCARDAPQRLLSFRLPAPPGALRPRPRAARRSPQHRLGGVLIGAAYGLARLAVGIALGFRRSARARASNPQVLRYATTAGPDVVVAALAAIGFYALARAASVRTCPSPGAGVAGRDRASDWRRFSATTRSSWRRRRSGRLAGPLAAQAAALAGGSRRRGDLRTPDRRQRTAGLGPFATAQSFNVYKLVHGVNWFHVDSSMAAGSIADVIRASPREFAAAWVHALVPSLLLLVPPLLLALFPGVAGRLGRFAAITIALYLPIVTMGSSSRADLPVLVLVATSAVALADQIWRRRRSLSSSSPPLHALVGLAVAVVILAWAGALVREDYGLVKHRRETADLYRRAGGAARRRRRDALEAGLRDRSLAVLSKSARAHAVDERHLAARERRPLQRGVSGTLCLVDRLLRA